MKNCLSLVAVIVLSSSMVGAQDPRRPQIAQGAQAAVDPEGEPLGQTDYRVLNSTGDHPFRPHIRGVGAIPIDLEVFDRRPWKERKLAVYLVIHEQDPANPLGNRPKRFVKPLYDSTQLISLTEEPNSGMYKRNIEMPKGRYLVYVFLCDPLEAYRPHEGLEKALGGANPPGNITRGSSIHANVD